MKFVWFAFLGMTAWRDIRTREIPVWLYALFGGIGILFVIEGIGNQEIHGLLDYGGLMLSLGIGVLLLLLGYLTGEAIGAGDGWFFLVSGLYLCWQENLALLCYSLLCCSMFSLGLVVWGRWRGVSVRKKKLPFLPFVFVSGIWVLCL